MNKCLIILGCIMLCAAGALPAQDTLKVTTLKVTTLLKTIDSLTVTSADYKEASTLVFYFYDDSCFFSPLYQSRMMQMVADEETSDVRFYGVNVGSSASFITDSTSGASLTLVTANTKAVASMLGVAKAPAVVVLHKIDENTFMRVYKGPPDNDPAYTLAAPENYVKNVLEELKKGTFTEPKTFSLIGCMIK